MTNWKAIVKTLIVIILLVVFPIVGRRWLPETAVQFVRLQIGFDLLDILNRIAIVGVMAATLILVSGHLEKDSKEFLIASFGWKAFWLFIVIFLLSLGYPETLGLATLGGEISGRANIVVFDFRLFILLVTGVIILMIVRSTLQFNEKRDARENQQKVSQ